MKKLLLLLITCLCVIGCSEENVISVESSDNSMNEAVERAKANLPVFRKALVRSKGDNFLIKARFEADSGGGEHIWLDEIALVGTSFSGRVTDVPRDVSVLKEGDRVTVTEGQVTDWMVIQGQMAFGAYTQLALLSQMPLDVAEFWSERIVTDIKLLEQQFE